MVSTIKLSNVAERAQMGNVRLKGYMVYKQSGSVWLKVLFLFLSILVVFLCCSALTATSEPVFELNFEKGLVPDIGPQKEGSWSGKEAPLFYEKGLYGKALLITDDPATAGMVSFPAPESSEESGTVLFWSRGLENWDLWGRGNNRNFWPTSNFFQAGGEGGGVMFYKWSWYDTLTYLWLPGGTQGNRAVGTWPHFDQYQWTQIGLSWQKEADGAKRIRFYLNGRLTSETSDIFPFYSFGVGGNVVQTGGRRLIDNLKIWDRMLTGAEAMREYRRDLGLVNRPVVSIPRLDAPPEINGKIHNSEWAGAASVTGMLEAYGGEHAVDQSMFYLGHDDGYLYVAMRGELTEIARNDPAMVYNKFLRTEITRRDGDVDTDDAVELILAPDYWKESLNAGEWKEYRLLANAIGTSCDRIYGADEVKQEWDINWQTSSSVAPDGWQFEARIPLDSLGAPVPGDRWGLQLGRIWKHLKEEHNSWAWGRRYLPEPDPKRTYPEVEAPAVPYQPDTIRNMHLHKTADSAIASLGIMRFGRSEEPVVRLQRLGRLTDHAVDLQAVFINPAETKQQLLVKLYTDSGEISCDERITLPEGGEIEFSKQYAINDFTTSRVTFEVYTANEELIHRTDVPFYLEQSFEVRTIHYPNYDTFLVELNLGVFDYVPLDEISVEILLKDDSGKIVFSDTRSITAYSTALKCNSEEIALGEYTMSTIIRHGEQELDRDESEFKRSGKAQWWDNRYGYEDMEKDQVPYPWTDMQVADGTTVHVWGRQYRFGNKLFPEQITTLDYPILRAPMRIVMETKEGQVIDTGVSEARGEWTKTNKTRVEGVRVVDGPGFSLKNSFWAEYDGLVWCTLTLEPKKNVEIVSMTLELPLTKQFTDVINPNSHRDAGKLKPEGYASARRTIWLGNGDGGVQWIPGKGKLFVQDLQKATRVEVETEGATLRITMIDVATEFDAPHEIEFGLIATPARPKTWRTPEHPSYRLWPATDATGGGFYPDGLAFMPAADYGQDYYAGASGGRLYVYPSTVNTGIDASETADFKHYGYEWLANPNHRVTSEETVETTSSSKSFRDYFVWRYWRYMQKYGFGGLYYDGYYGVMGGRDIMKRLYNITLNNPKFEDRDQQIGLHESGTVDMAFAAFATYHWDAEHMNSIINSSQPTYIGIVDPALFRAQYMGHNFGWNNRFLGQMRVTSAWAETVGGPNVVYDHMVGLALLHDTLLPSHWPCCLVKDVDSDMLGNYSQDYRAAGGAVQKHNFYHWQYQFLPYWHQDIVALPDENMYASFYIAQPSKLIKAINSNDYDLIDSYFGRRLLPDHIKRSIYADMRAAREELEQMEDKVIMVVVNDSDWEGRLRLRPDWQKLGFVSNEVIAVEMAAPLRDNEKAEIEDDELVFPITKWAYRMMVIEKKTSR